MIIGTSFLGRHRPYRTHRVHVTAANQRLNPVTLVTVQVPIISREVEHVHEHCSHRSNASQDGEELCVDSDSALKLPLGALFCAEVFAEVLFCSAMDVLLYMVCRSLINK